MKHASYFKSLFETGNDFCLPIKHKPEKESSCLFWLRPHLHFSNLGTLHGVQNSQGTFWKKYVCSEYDLDMIIITKEIFKSISTVRIRKELFSVMLDL